MSYLTDIVASSAAKIKTTNATAKNQTKSTTRGAFSAGSAGVAGIPAKLYQDSVSQATVGASQAINVGSKAIVGAASSAMSGDFSGALATLSQGPSDVLGALASAFGFKSGQKLTGPAQSIAPGNSLAGIQARSDPLMSFSWYAELPTVTDLAGTPHNLDWFFVEEATLPFRTFEVRSIFREGRQRHYPSTYTVDTLRLAIYADSSNKAIDYLQGWQGAVLKPTSLANAVKEGGGYGLPMGSRGYKKNIVIYLTDVAKQKLARLTYTECWPISMDPYTMDSNSSTRIVNQVTFSVGDVFVEILPLTNAASTSNPQRFGAPPTLISMAVNSVASLFGK